MLQATLQKSQKAELQEMMAILLARAFATMMSRWLCRVLFLLATSSLCRQKHRMEKATASLHKASAPPMMSLIVLPLFVQLVRTPLLLRCCPQNCGRPHGACSAARVLSEGLTKKSANDGIETMRFSVLYGPFRCCRGIHRCGKIVEVSNLEAQAAEVTHPTMCPSVLSPACAFPNTLQLKLRWLKKCHPATLAIPTLAILHNEAESTSMAPMVLLMARCAPKAKYHLNRAT